jgi:predicted nucleic acid-binding protein
MPLLLDTSILIGGQTDPEDEVAISAVSIAELHFGVLVAGDDEARAIRLRRLAVVEEAFDPLPFDATVARECGKLHAAVVQRGGQPRRRSFDLAIAATANVHGVPLLTVNVADFQLIEDLVDLRSPRSLLREA